MSQDHSFESYLLHTQYTADVFLPLYHITSFSKHFIGQNLTAQYKESHTPIIKKSK